MEDELYREHILEHYRHPRNKRAISDASVSAKAVNPVCGDIITVYFLFDEKGGVADMAFDGESCAIATASASLLTDHAKGKTARELKVMTPGDVYSLLAITINPARTACALLPYRAMLDALQRHDA